MVIKERWLNVKELSETGSFDLKTDALRQYLSRGEFAKFRNGKYYLYNEELVCTFKNFWRKIKRKKMNNREYLFSLPDKELIKYLTCKACDREFADEELDKCFGDCESCQVEWLNSGYSQQNNSEELDTIS